MLLVLSEGSWLSGCIGGGYSHVVQDTPATVGVPGAQALSTRPVLLTRLDGHLGDLETQGVEKVSVLVLTEHTSFFLCLN